MLIPRSWSGVAAAGSLLLATLPAFSADLDEARRLLESGYNGKALKIAEQELAANPDDPQAREIESGALLGLKRPGAAIERAEAWATRAPGDPRPLVLLARAVGAKQDWVALRRVALRVKDGAAEARLPVFRAVAREYCGGPGCEVATDLLADLAASAGSDPEHLLDVTLEIASRGERDRALFALERYLRTEPAERDVEFALYATARALVRAAERGDPNPPAEGFTIEIPDGSGIVTPPVRVSGERPELPASAWRTNTRIVATIQCVILRTGHVVPIKIHDVTDSDFAARCFESALKWRYEPATKDGVPVPCTLALRTSVHRR